MAARVSDGSYQVCKSWHECPLCYCQVTRLGGAVGHRSCPACGADMQIRRQLLGRYYPTTGKLIPPDDRPQQAQADRDDP